MRRARRVTSMLALLLLLGACLTVAVAWGIEALDSRRARSVMVMGGAPGKPLHAWMGTVPDGWPLRPQSTAIIGQGGRIDPTSLEMKGAERLRVRQGMFAGVASSPAGVSFMSDDPAHVLERVEVGWPVRAMTRRGTDDARPRESGVPGILHNGIPIGADRAFPLCPMWGPFLLSAVGWATVCAAPWLASRAARAFIARRRRGRGGCPACGYDWADLPVCPECGGARRLSDSV